MANIAKPPCDEAIILAAPCDRPAPANGGWIIAATILGSSMAFHRWHVVNVALPAIQSDLGATISDVQWVVEAYALLLAALLLAGGALGDLYGRRKVFAAGVALFSAASAWCGLLDTGVEVADHCLPKGALIVSHHGRVAGAEVHRRQRQPRAGVSHGGAGL